MEEVSNLSVSMNLHPSKVTAVLGYRLREWSKRSSQNRLYEGVRYEVSVRGLSDTNT